MDVASKRELLKRNRLCFNCAKSGHAVSQRNSLRWGRCNARNLTSICERTFTTIPPKSNANTKPPWERFYGANDFQTTLHSSVLAKVNGVQTWVMLDSRAGGSYIGSYLLAKLNMKPYRTERRVIKQSMGQWTNELRYTTSMLNQMSLTVLEWIRVVMCQCWETCLNLPA